MYQIEKEKNNAKVYFKPTPKVDANQKVADLTKRLKDLSPEDLKIQTEEYKRLVEARELEDILFS